MKPKIKKNGEFCFEIDKNFEGKKTPRHSVYAYLHPDSSLYVNGVWIKPSEMSAMILAMQQAIEYIKRPPPQKEET